MKELRICSVSDAYICYLRAKIPNVYSNKDQNRTHTRKYLGVVMDINNYKYYIPLSSPKKSDYQLAGPSLVIKKSIVPIIRITRKNRTGDKELLGTLRISHMIPVPDSELIPYNIESETDAKYKVLVEEEYSYIHKNRERICKNVEVMYKQKNEGYEADYVSRALNYSELERMCDEFIGE